MTINLLLAAVMLVPTTATPPPPRPNCTSPQSHQFDFWVGSWEVRPTSRPDIIAHSLIEKRYSDCAIRENWMPVGKEISGGGGSLSNYDDRRQKWRQAWVDSSGTRVDFDGGFTAGIMTLQGVWENMLGPGKDALVRMHYQLLLDGAVHQWSEQSIDQGKTWQPGFNFIYRRMISAK